MAKSLAQGEAKWSRKTAQAGENWKRGTAGAGQRYSQGLAGTLGGPPSGHIVQSYESGIGAVSAADFQQAVAGKGTKWAENYRRAMTGS